MSDAKSPPDKSTTIAEMEGRSNSNINAHKIAQAKWDEFAKLQNYPAFSDLKQVFICGEVQGNGSLSNPNDPPIRKYMAEFANYLLTYQKKGAVKEGTSKYYAVNVMKQHFTTMKSIMFKKFPPLGFAGKDPDWYNDLLTSLKVRASTNAIARGELISKKAVGMTRDALKECCAYLMKQHDLFEARGYEERCILCTLFHAVGRGGEVSTATWDNAYWNEELQHFSLHWGEYKNGQQYEMTFHPDMYSWELDWFHAMACFLLCGEGGHKASLASEGDGINWMFPNYVDMAEGGAAAKCSRVLAKCKVGHVEGIPADTSPILRDPSGPFQKNFQLHLAGRYKSHW